MPITIAEENAHKRLEVKVRSTLMIGIPNEHQLKFNLIKEAKQLLEAVEKRFGGNAATKKTQRNLLKHEYENFTATSSEMLDQTFDRLQNLESQLELLGEKLLQEDVNQKLLRSLSPEWNTHTVVWRNKIDLDTMSMYNLYNNLKVYKPEVKGMSSSSSSIQNMDFVSSLNNNSSNNNKAVNTAHRVSTASTQVNVAFSTNFDNLSDVVICAFLGVQSSKKSRQQAQEKLKKECACKTSTSQALVSCDEEFVNKPIIENYKAKSSKEKPKEVRKNDDALIIEDWLLDNEEEDVSQPKIEKKIVWPSIAKKEFVKSKHQEKTTRKTVKQVKQHRKNTHRPRGTTLR
nr:hypothetical protein [Tanacetum cinerariifolium]